MSVVRGRKGGKEGSNVKDCKCGEWESWKST